MLDHLIKKVEDQKLVEYQTKLIDQRHFQVLQKQWQSNGVNMTTKMTFELDSKDIQKLSELFKIYKKETADYNANMNTFVSSLIEYVYICKVLGINENLSFSKYQSLK